MSNSKTRKEAYRQAKEKRILLNEPKTWKIRVWENMGWHWSLSRGKLHLYFEDYNNSFHSLLSAGAYSGSGEVFWTHNFYSKNPNRVVEEQLKAAKQFVKRCQDAIASSEGRNGQDKN